jgi:hypothetical protein
MLLVSVLVAAILQGVGVVTLDPERAKVTFISRAHAAGMVDLLHADDDQEVIFQEAVKDAAEKADLCVEFYLSSLSWTLRWTDEVNWLGHGPQHVRGFSLDEDLVWQARLDLQEQLFQTLEALLPDQRETIQLVWRSRRRVLVNRDGYPPVACPDLVDSLLQFEPAALEDPQGQWLPVYAQRADELTKRREELFRNELPLLRRQLERGTLETDRYRSFCLEMGQNAADFRKLVRETSNRLLALDLINESAHESVVVAMYPARIDRSQIALSWLLEETSSTSDEAARRRLQQLAAEITEASRARWRMLRAAFDEAYEPDAIAAWSDAMAAQIDGGPSPDFYAALTSARERPGSALEPALAAEISQLEQSRRAPVIKRPIQLRSDEYDVLRDSLNEADAIIGLRFAWFLPDLLREHELLNHATSTPAADQYTANLTALVGALQNTLPQYTEMVDDQNAETNRRLKPVIIEVASIVRSIDSLNRKALDELAESGHVTVCSAAIEQAYESVLKPSPIHGLVEQLMEPGCRLSEEERASVQQIWERYLAAETKIRDRLVAALSSWESPERTVVRINEADRAGNVQFWRRWNESSHPSIPIWQEQTDHARRIWKELSGVFPEPRRSELSIPLQLALKLGDGL